MCLWKRAIDSVCFGPVVLMSLCLAESPALILTSNRNDMESIGRHHHHHSPGDGRGVGTTVTTSCAKYRTHTGSETQGNKKHSHTGCAGSTTKATTTSNEHANTDCCVTPTEIHNSLRNIHKPDNFLEAAYVIFTTLW